MLSPLFFIFIFTGQGFVLAQSDNSTDELIFLEEEEEMKPGFQMIKEFHFHPYWHQNNPEEEAAALSLRDAIVNEVAIGNMTVVCDGVNSGILSDLSALSPDGGFFAQYPELGLGYSKNNKNAQEFE